MSSTSLYGTTGNVTVSANNLTTLYSATGGNVVTANVPDRNFTTLYATTQSQVLPTRPYGNANVEAFLNSGTDGANTVQNINMSGSLTVGGVSNLGPVGNVIITGGSSGYVLTTNGLGDLIWAEGTGGGGNTVPYIHFDVSSTGNNQTFTSDDIGFYPYANSMAVMKNGINIEPDLYGVSGNVLTVNILLNTGDTIDILPSAGGGGGLPGGLPNTVQYNNGYTFSGDSTFTFNETTNTLTVENINIQATTTLQQGIEKVTSNSTGSTGTINYDLLTQAILNKTGNATASFNINVRGNSSVTLDTVMSNNQSMTCTYINKKGATPYVMSLFQVDGTTQTVYWLNGTNPTTNAYTYDIYTFNILKTGANTYTVFGNFGSYS